MNPAAAMFALAVIVGSVRVHGAREQFDEHGAPRDPAAVNAAAGALLNQLAWWAHTLRHARAVHPYGT